ncbi:MAG: 30S ribosomal protein S2 [Alphaproteobacteria bacterium MarineAlpha9_Bin3]|nr:MAG: 30S ribosomal protein S2 [Alphaproteobacteria bacterium MarineAlpha9_Bin3]|tara:strand:+ start:7631 stop:8551 length:921 start_codon:yes stop_codon:yes gene_type:complete
MALPNYTMKELLEAGIHFGHQLNRWNPKMESYLFGERNGIHIIDLQQTYPLIQNALKVIRDIAAGGGRVLFVGTKRQAQKIIAESAINSGQYFMNHRWLGGTLTNWKTISKSIVRLKNYDEILNKEDSGLTKKELVGIQRQRDKLEASLGGIKDMGGLPDALFVIDTNKEHIAIKEANVLKIPVIAVIDSNSNPDGVDFPIPGNDDATRAISLYCRLMSESILDGLQVSFSESGKDIGASDQIKEELNITDKSDESVESDDKNIESKDDSNKEVSLEKENKDIDIAKESINESEDVSVSDNKEADK